MENLRPVSTLSACIMVKNEEKFLPGCLESIKDIVDEIIIVDTGSTDNTINIAKSYGAKIYHYPWRNHFSKARNQTIRYATCDWILYIDADEELDKDDGPKLKQALNDDSVNVIYIPIVGRKYGVDKNTTIVNTERVYRNHLGFHYKGAVHNALQHRGMRKCIDAKLYHYGYNLDKEAMERKFERSSVLLEAWAEKDKMNPTPCYYLMALCLAYDMYDECIKYAWRTLRLAEYHGGFKILRVLSLYTLAVCFYNKKLLGFAERYALQALIIFPQDIDAYCILGAIYHTRKEYDRYKFIADRYLNLDPRDMGDVPFTTPGMRDQVVNRLKEIEISEMKEAEQNN